ncbi:KAP family P-loop NTPase fold protein [Psychrobacter sp.]|uniref:KAP family P-loop NTPase fold protein n=1 Tax=Psychrobacter sp. TaxID=56811 RepID=UPI002FDA1E7C
MKISNDRNIKIPINNIYLNDKFDREPEVLNIVELITKLSDPCTIAIDSPWGTGKTTFLKFLEAELQKKEIKVSYFNAWENDFDREPFLLILNHIIKQFSQEKDIKEIKKIAIKVLKSIAVNGSKAIVDLVAPIGIGNRLIEISEEAVSALAGEVFDNFTKEEKEVKLLQDKLSLLIENDNKMVILIDELDRCKPSFCIELLERIKHIFDTPNIIFVLGTDLEQLGKAISGVYGESYNGQKYLERFFDFEINLNTPDYNKFWQSLSENYSGKDNIRTLENRADIEAYGIWFTQHLQLSARDVTRLYTKFYLASLSEYAGNDLPLILLLSVVKSYSRELFNNMRLDSFDLDELLDLLKIKDITMDNNSAITPQILALIHNLLLVDQNEVKSSKIVNLLSERFTNPNMKVISKQFIERYKDEDKLSINNLDSIYKAVDLQGISHKQYANVISSMQTTFGEATIISNN